MGLQERSQEELKEVRKRISRFCSTVFQKWKTSHRMLDRFLLHNSEWSDKKLFVPVSPVPHTAKGRQERPSLNQAKEAKDGKQKVYAELLLLKNCLLLLRWASEEVEIRRLQNPYKSRSYDAYQSIKNLPSLEWEERGDCNVEIFGRWGALSVNWCAIV